MVHVLRTHPQERVATVHTWLLKLEACPLFGRVLSHRALLIKNKQTEMHFPVICHINLKQEDCFASSDRKIIHRWMDREDVVHIHNGMLLSHEKGMKSCHLQPHGWTQRWP